VSRHTYTDLALLATDENIYMVQKSLGHSSVKTTEGYAKNRVNYEKKTLITLIMQILEKAKN
jgi:integrase